MGFLHFLNQFFAIFDEFLKIERDEGSAAENHQTFRGKKAFEVPR